MRLWELEEGDGGDIITAPPDREPEDDDADEEPIAENWDDDSEDEEPAPDQRRPGRPHIEIDR